MNQKLPRYLRLLLRPPTLDLQTAVWEMIYLLYAPRKVYRSIYYRQQNRGHWARDDPSYVVLISLLVVTSAIAWGLAYSPSIGGILKLIIYMVVVDFVAFGMIIATLEWAVAQYLMLKDPNQHVEWAYSFDVHTNAFLLIWVYLYVIQFILLPVIQRKNWLSMLLGNSLYLAAYAHYFVIVFMGYSTLPFLRKTQLFLVPIGIGAVAYLFSLFGFSMVRFMLAAYFK